MISKDDIKKLANLARIEMKEEEVTKLQGDIGSILEYVGQVKDATSEYSSEVKIGKVRNVFRTDDMPNETGAITEALLKNAPDTSNGYVKVKKIL